MWWGAEDRPRRGPCYVDPPKEEDERDEEEDLEFGGKEEDDESWSNEATSRGTPLQVGLCPYFYLLLLPLIMHVYSTKKLG